MSRYTISNNYDFIEIEDKDYGYCVSEECFAIEQSFVGYDYDYDEECLCYTYTRINYDNETGEKLEIDDDLKEYILKAKQLKSEFDLQKQQEKIKREEELRELERLQKEREQQKYKEYIDEFGKEKADEIMAVEDNPKVPDLSNMFGSCNFLTSIPRFDTQRDDYVKKLREEMKSE